MINSDFERGNTNTEKNFLKLPNGLFNDIYDSKSGNVIMDDDSKKLNNFLSGYSHVFAQPYIRSSFKYFIEQIKNKFKSIIDYGGNHKFWMNSTYRNKYMWDYHNLGQGYNNFYTENEVDLYVPQKETYTYDNCQVTDEFKKVWVDSIIGVFTNHRCVEEIQNTSGINSDFVPTDKPDFKDLPTFIQNNIKYSGNKKIMGKIDCTTKNYTCTCSSNNYENLDNIVKLIVKNFNKKTGRKINGYIMNDDMKLDQDYPDDFNKNNITKPLKIQQITDY